jgi:hypothetical protein
VPRPHPAGGVPRALRIALLAASLACGAGADVALVPASRDTTLYESELGLLANGSGDFLFAGRTKEGKVRRALLAFDLSASIPQEATIISASLTLRMTKGISNDHPATLHRVLEPWGEGASDAPEEEGEGAPAEPGDATWLHTFFDHSLWPNAGGDFSPEPSAAGLVGGVGSYTWGPTPEMAADAQAWLDDPANAQGWLLLGDESTAYSAKRYASRENSDAGARPLLTVEFKPPCPADCDTSTGRGVLDLFDILCFQNAFAAGLAAADCTGDGLLALDDFHCFLAAFDAGCH